MVSLPPHSSGVPVSQSQPNMPIYPQQQQQHQTQPDTVYQHQPHQAMYDPSYLSHPPQTYASLQQSSQQRPPAPSYHPDQPQYHPQQQQYQGPAEAQRLQQQRQNGTSSEGLATQKIVAHPSQYNANPSDDGKSSTKRNVVTSCDSCRASKLKCNAKDLEPGQNCDKCVKNNMSCSFEAFKAFQQRGSLSDRGDRKRTASVAGIKRSSVSGESGGSGEDTIARLAQQLWPETQVMQSKSGWPGSNAYTMNGPPTKRQSVDQGSSSRHTTPASVSAPPLPPPAPWDSWGLPTTLTDPSGHQREISNSELIQFLIVRFYERPTFASAVVWRTEVTSRLQHSRPSPLPDYLLHAICACAAAAPHTHEPELRNWKTHGWRTAMASIHVRLRSHFSPELELIQALLLLASNWLGGNPDCVERTTTFETAFRLTFTLNLHSNKHAGQDPSERARRIALFWTVFIADKLIAVACGRPALVTTEQHNIPLLTLDDLLITGALDGVPSASQTQEERVLLHRLALSFIWLAQILEETQRLLYSLGTAHAETLEELHARIRPIESKLEQWCKDHRPLLQSSSEQGPLCRMLTEAMVAQLHLTQLQLYQPALLWEHERSNNAAIAFSAANSKALTACIESAWHLVQQPVQADENGASSPFSSAAATSNMVNPPAQLNFASFAVMRATKFLKFLSTAWSMWNGGMGMLQYTPRAVPDQASNGVTDVTAPPHMGPPQQQQQQRGAPAQGPTPAFLPPQQVAPPPLAAPRGRQPAQSSTLPTLPAQTANTNQPLARASPDSTGSDKGSASMSSSVGSRKAAPPPLFLNNTSPFNGTNNVPALPSSTFRLDTATLAAFALPNTPARMLFDGAGFQMNDSLGAMMTPLRPDFLGGLDIGIDFGGPVSAHWNGTFNLKTPHFGPGLSALGDKEGVAEASGEGGDEPNGQTAVSGVTE